MPRSVPEWHGSTPDARIPNAVRARIWLRCEGRCALTGLKIDAAKQAYDLDHIKPLSMGGEHREGNLQLVLREAHRRKTATEATARAKADRIRLKNIGAWPKSKRPIQSRGFPKSRPEPVNDDQPDGYQHQWAKRPFRKAST